MASLIKGFTSVFIALILLAVIGTGIILYYNNKDKGEEVATTTEGTVNENLPGNENTLNVAKSEESTETATENSTDSTVSSDEGIIEGVIPTGTNSNNHSHDYLATIGKEPTCTVIGKMLYTCACGAYYIEPIATIDHSPGVLKETKEATKTSEGLKQQRCMVCSTVLKEEVIPKLPTTTDKDKDKEKESETETHHYVGKVTKEATCTENGVITYTCKDKDCDDSYTKDIPGLNHPSRQTIVTEATCGTDGKVVTSCSICKAVISNDTLIAPDHDFGSWKVTKQPTTTALGEKTRTCKNCKEKETKDVPMVGTSGTSHTHVYSSKTTTAATCTTAGVKTFTCTCSINYTEEIPALEHNPGNWQTVTPATEKTPGVRKKFCRRCSKELESEEVAFVPTHTHSYTSKVIKPATCKESGTKEYTCSTCGDTYPSTIDPTGMHTKKVDPKDSSKFICSVCGDSLN